MADENLEGLEGLDDFGDDFGDQLDSFMEGDEDEGDSELDSFFEDLSTIDDLEMKEDGGSEPEATPEEAPAEDAEPETAEAEAESKVTQANSAIQAQSVQNHKLRTELAAQQSSQPTHAWQPQLSLFCGRFCA